MSSTCVSHKKRKLLQLLACCLIQVNRVRCQAAQQIVIFPHHQHSCSSETINSSYSRCQSRCSCAFTTKENKAKIHTKTQFLILQSLFSFSKESLSSYQGNFLISKRLFSHLSKAIFSPLKGNFLILPKLKDYYVQHVRPSTKQWTLLHKSTR